jgi:multidrug efflux pump subunit AcrA (membrane-fusion protein)
MQRAGFKVRNEADMKDMTKFRLPSGESAISNLQSAILAAGLALLACAGPGGPGRKQADRLTQSVEVVTVGLDTVTRTVQLLGMLQGERQAMAMPKFAGKVTEIVKPEGSPVTEGDPIALVVNDIPGMDYKPGPVRSPVSGVVGKVYVEVGQTVAPSMPVAAVSSFTDRVKVKAAVSDADLPFVKTGAQAAISVSAIPDRTFSGHVSQVSPMLDPMSRSATVELSVANQSRKLIPGMTASVRLTLERRAGVLTIPSSALFTDGGNRVVVVEGSTARVREIAVGLSGDAGVEVISGLTAGDKVATTGKERVKDGETVNPVQAKSELSTQHPALSATGDTIGTRQSPVANPSDGPR